MNWVDVRDAKGHLLFRYDPERHVIEWVARGVRTIIDLRKYMKQPNTQPQPP